MKPIIPVMRTALEQIQELHTGEPYAQGSDYCEECEHRWPCPTRKLADEGLAGVK